MSLIYFLISIAQTRNVFICNKIIYYRTHDRDLISIWNYVAASSQKWNCS